MKMATNCPYFFVDRKEYAKRKEVMDELDKSSVYMTGIKKHDITYQNTFEPCGYKCDSLYE